MVVAGVSPEFRGSLAGQIERVVGSETLRGSEALCHLLEYLAAHAISDPGNSAKEYQIATEVFGRSPKFDPRLDSTVRVQTSRLRAKLAEYYAGPGAEDQIIIEIPRGSYSVAVHRRTHPVDSAQVQSALSPPETAALPASHTFNPFKVVSGLLALMCCGLLAFLVYSGPKPVRNEGAKPEASSALSTFWKVFTRVPERTWIIFSNAEFVGRPETGLRYLDSGRDNGKPIFDHYTGIGEVMAIHELDQLFNLLHHPVNVKRGRLLAMDDVKSNDLIFVGSSAENLMLRDLPALQSFAFQRAETGPRKGDLAIVNLQSPVGGQPFAYYATEGNPLTEDYAVIALKRGPTTLHWVMILAGITTIGTQAAVEYVCSQTGVEQLLKRAGSSDDQVSPFEALIRVRVSRGVPVSSELVALHSRGS